MAFNQPVVIDLNGDAEDDNEILIVGVVNNAIPAIGGMGQVAGGAGPLQVVQPRHVVDENNLLLPGQAPQWHMPCAKLLLEYDMLCKVGIATMNLSLLSFNPLGAPRYVCVHAIPMHEPCMPVYPANCRWQLYFMKRVGGPGVHPSHPPVDFSKWIKELNLPNSKVRPSTIASTRMYIHLLDDIPHYVNTVNIDLRNCCGPLLQRLQVRQRQPHQLRQALIEEINLNARNVLRNMAVED